MRLLSTTFRGTWPPGIHWTPGEVRTLPDAYPMPKGEDGELVSPPEGLEQVEDEPEPDRRRRRRARPASPAPAPAAEESSAR